MRRPSVRSPAATLLVVYGLAMVLALWLPGGWADPQAATASEVISPSVVSLVAGDGDGSDAATGMVIGPDGTVYVCGHVWHEATGEDITVSRLGDPALGWTMTWNGPDPSSWDEALDIAVSSDGSVYACGRAQGVEGTKPILLKYSASGELLWEAWPVDLTWVHDGSATQLAVDEPGNVYVLGSMHSGDEDLESVFVAKYRPDGTEAWSTRYTMRGYYKIETHAADFVVEPRGRCYVVGWAEGGDFGNGDGGPRAFALSLRSDGTRRWARRCRGLRWGTAAFSALTGCPSGGICAVGWARGAARDVLVVRYRADGTHMFTRRLGIRDRQDEFANDVAVDSRGRIAICGSWPRRDRGFYVAVLRKNGSIKWSRDYATARSARRLVVDASDRVCAVGVVPAGAVVAHAFARDGVLRWSSAWTSSPTPGSNPHLPGVGDMVTNGRRNVFVCGATDLRPGTGSDQFVLGWPLD